MPTYQHEGLNLYYEVIGTGPPVLCVHGATCAGDYEWAKVADALKEHYRFVIPDLRGHRHSDYRAGEMSIEAVDRDLVELISHERLTPPHVLAFSFGAETALELELTYPATAASLILLSPGLGDPKSSVPTRAQLETGWPRSLRALHAQDHGEEHWLDIMLELCERAAARPKADLDAIAQIRCPVLLVLGSHDDPRRPPRRPQGPACGSRQRHWVLSRPDIRACHHSPVGAGELKHVEKREMRTVGCAKGISADGKW